MAQTSYPFDGQDTTESQFGRWAREFQDTGVAGSYGSTTLQVSANSSAMAVNIQPGFAIVRGTAYRSDAVETLSIDAVPTSRVDRVVLQLNPTTNTTQLAVKKGTSTTPPALTQTDDGLYEMPLAAINLTAGQVTVAAANVTDERVWVGSRVGVWTTATRPTSPRRFQMGRNVTLNIFEYHDGTNWVDVNGGASQANTWVQMTQAAYNALTPKNANTLYVIVG